MDTVEPHGHKFSSDQWPFKVPVNQLAYTSGKVLHSGQPILLVFHDHDGEWQFLHGPVDESDEGFILCQGCAFDRDSSVGDLADMPAGWMASRDSIDSAWQRETYESGEDEV